MKVAIISPRKILFEGEAVSVNCKTTNGEITILDHHRPLITELAAGTIKVVGTDHKENYVPATSGFLEMLATNTARLLVDEDR